MAEEEEDSAVLWAGLELSGGDLEALLEEESLLYECVPLDPFKELENGLRKLKYPEGTSAKNESLALEILDWPFGAGMGWLARADIAPMDVEEVAILEAEEPIGALCFLSGSDWLADAWALDL